MQNEGVNRMPHNELSYIQILEQVGAKFTSATGQSISFIGRGGEWQSSLNLECFTPFCRKVISSEKGRRLCCECNNTFQKTAHGKIDISQCHMGVCLVSVPVKSEQNNLLISYGQFLLKGTEDAFYTALPQNCQKLGIDFHELRPLAEHLRVFSRAELEDKIELLKLFSNYANVMENEYHARQRYYQEYQEKLDIESKLSSLEYDLLQEQINQTFITEALTVIANTAYQEHAVQTSSLLYDLLYIILKNDAIKGKHINDREKELFSEEFKRFQGVISSLKHSSTEKEDTDANINQFVTKACIIIKSRYSQPISLESVAKELHITPVYLSRIFKKVMGKNFKEYLIDIRMTEAQQLLKEGDYTVGEIAAKVGYEDASYFSRAYKKQFGYTPKIKKS